MVSNRGGAEAVDQLCLRDLRAAFEGARAIQALTSLTRVVRRAHSLRTHELELVSQRLVGYGVSGWVVRVGPVGLWCRAR
jgi:hypothetical protein